MADRETDRLIRLLQERGVAFVRGLSDSEIDSIEQQFGFRFPPELKCLLQTAMPVSEGFVDWRSAAVGDIRSRLSAPTEGILFDIRHNGFWYKPWGAKPVSMDERVARAVTFLKNTPILIPIFAHRYIPSWPYEGGNPVFSVHQTDVIYYGNDLFSYLCREFGIEQPVVSRTEPKWIEFWSDLALNSDRIELSDDLF